MVKRGGICHGADRPAKRCRNLWSDASQTQLATIAYQPRGIIRIDGKRVLRKAVEPCEISLPGSVRTWLESRDHREALLRDDSQMMLRPATDREDDSRDERGGSDHQVRVGREIDRDFHATISRPHADAGAEAVGREEHDRDGCRSK